VLSMPKLRSLSAFLVAPLITFPGQAQFTQRSSITGTITDSSGAVVPNVRVVLSDLDQNKKMAVQTNGSGQYSLPS
jgi:hypothetical protein